MSTKVKRWTARMVLPAALVLSLGGAAVAPSAVAKPLEPSHQQPLCRNHHPKISEGSTPTPGGFGFSPTIDGHGFCNGETVQVYFTATYEGSRSTWSDAETVSVKTNERFSVDEVFAPAENVGATESIWAVGQRSGRSNTITRRIGALR